MLLVPLASAPACDPGEDPEADRSLWIPPTATSTDAADMPSFTLAWSDHPARAVFSVAEHHGFIDGRAGLLGRLESSYGVDLVLARSGHRETVAAYLSGAADAICASNYELLIAAEQRPAVAILPAALSRGADAVVLLREADAERSGAEVVALPRGSAAEHLFSRTSGAEGFEVENPRLHHIDIQRATQALSTRPAPANARGVATLLWDPFLARVLDQHADVEVIADSSDCPFEIVELVAIAQEALDRPGGHEAAWLIADAFYEGARIASAPDVGDGTLRRLAGGDPDLSQDGLRRMMERTHLLAKPGYGAEAFESLDLQNAMQSVVETALELGAIDARPTQKFPKTVNIDESGAPIQYTRLSLIFDDTWMKQLHRGRRSRVGGPADRVAGVGEAVEFSTD